MSNEIDIQDITNQAIAEINKHYREARQAGEMLIKAGKISFKDYDEWMQGFETMLKDEGVEM